MAVKEAPPPGLLDSFSAPLWERLNLSGLRPQWIVKGQHRGYDWVVIELEHRATGLTAESGTDTTTVFVMRLPRKSKDWYLPPHRITSVQQACVDDQRVYVAALGRQPRVREWRHWLDTAADVADEVVRSEGSHTKQAHEHPGDHNTAGSEAGPSWNPHDGKWVVFWLFVMVPIAGVVFLSLLFDYSDWPRTGAVIKCNMATHIGSALYGWKMWAHLGMLATPLAWMCKMIHTMVTRIHRPGFGLQIHLEGAILLGGAFVLAHALGALEASARAVC